jgi:hypothetical protein
MAFGKKKDELAPDADAPDTGAIEPLFPADDGDDEDAETPAPEVAPAPVEAAPAAAAANPADSLLSMFQTDHSEETDRSALIDLSGDVDLADLLEELHTLAAAMGIQTAA